MNNPSQKESVSTRSIRYMSMLNGHRGDLRVNIRSYRDPHDLPRSNHSCDDLIDIAINRVAKSTLETGTDFSDPDELYESIKSTIKQRFEEKPDKGFALGE